VLLTGQALRLLESCCLSGFTDRRPAIRHND
jgi:hypothetical protein